MRNASCVPAGATCPAVSTRTKNRFGSRTDHFTDTRRRASARSGCVDPSSFGSDTGGGLDTLLAATMDEDEAGSETGVGGRGGGAVRRAAATNGETAAGSGIGGGGGAARRAEGGGGGLEMRCRLGNEAGGGGGREDWEGAGRED